MDCTENRAKYCHLTDEEKAMFPIERKKDGMYCILKDNGETDFCSHDTGFNPRSIYRLNLIDGEWYRVSSKVEQNIYLFKYKPGKYKTSGSVFYNIIENSIVNLVMDFVCTDPNIQTLQPAPPKEIQKVEALLNPAPKLPDWVVFENQNYGLELRFNNGKNCLSAMITPYFIDRCINSCIINNSTLTLIKVKKTNNGKWYYYNTLQTIYLAVDGGFVKASQKDCSIKFVTSIPMEDTWEITHNG